LLLSSRQCGLAGTEVAVLRQQEEAYSGDPGIGHLAIGFIWPHGSPSPQNALFVARCERRSGTGQPLILINFMIIIALSFVPIANINIIIQEQAN
jgi:hypothetical protein